MLTFHNRMWGEEQLSEIGVRRQIHIEARHGSETKVAWERIGNQ